MDDRLMLLLGGLTGLLLVGGAVVVVGQRGGSSDTDLGNGTTTTILVTTTVAGETTTSAAAPTTASPTTAAPTTAAPTTAAPTTVAPPTTGADGSFLPSAEVRCLGGETLLAAGVGSRFEVTICADTADRLTYRGVRARDRASIALAACEVSPGRYEAVNEGNTYVVLLGTAGTDGVLQVIDPAGAPLVDDTLESMIDPVLRALGPC